jgi:hypothetical protein
VDYLNNKPSYTYFYLVGIADLSGVTFWGLRSVRKICQIIFNIELLNRVEKLLLLLLLLHMLLNAWGPLLLLLLLLHMLLNAWGPLLPLLPLLLLLLLLHVLNAWGPI